MCVWLLSSRGCRQMKRLEKNNHICMHIYLHESIHLPIYLSTSIYVYIHAYIIYIYSVCVFSCSRHAVVNR